MRKVRRMKEEGKSRQSKGSLPKGRLAERSQISGAKRRIPSRGGSSLCASRLRLVKPPRKWDACGEASLPIDFEGRCRAAGTFGVYRPFFFPSFDSHFPARHTLFSSSVFSVSSVVNPSQNKLDDCLSRFENTHLFSPMNLHLQPQESFFSPPLQTSGVFVHCLTSRFWSGFQRHAK